MNAHPVLALAAGADAFQRQWHAPARLREFQLRRLRAVVAHAWSSSAFYRQLWRAAGPDGPRLDRLEDARRLPVISKEDIHDRLDTLIPAGYSEQNCLVDRTSGSSGLVIPVLTDEAAYRYLAAVWMRAHLAYGLRPHHRLAYFRYSPARAGLLDRVGLFRSYHVPFDAPVPVQFARVRSIEPHVLGGYPSHLLALAAGIPPEQLRALRLRALVAGSETLTPADRQVVEHAFGAPVYDLYGCFEFNNVAFECRAGQRHLNADSVFVEVLVDGRPAPPGVPGELVITGLWNRAMPLIRYRIGDTGSWSDRACRCGRGLPLLPRLDGRSKDVLVGPAGRVTQVVVSEGLKSVRGLQRYQVRQRELGRIEASLVVRGAEDAAVARQVAERLRRLLGGVDVVTEVVQTLAPGPGGKARPVVSQLGGADR